MPSPGELLGARYRLDDRIAAGGMGEVWRATDTVLDRPVAVKTLLAGYAGDTGFRTRFHHEARAMAALRHAGVAPVYDFGDTGDGAFLVMARVDGVPLNQWIAERGPLTPHQTMSIVAQAARALAAAHEAGIVHRDVKPGNLIVEPDGTVVLVDFGVARSANSVTLTGAKEVVGTALYIAPEQVAKRVTTSSADLYALGVVAYHCLAGRPPFMGDNPLMVALQHLDSEPPPLPDSVPAPVRELIETALAKDPAARFPSATAMAEAAEAAAPASFVGAVAVAPPLPPPTEATQQWVAPDSPPPPRRRRAVLAIAAALLTLLGIGAVFAATDPFGYFEDNPASTPTPSAGVPSQSPSPAKKGNAGQQKAKTNPAAEDDDRTSTGAEDDQPEATRPPATSTTTAEPEPTRPEETATTTEAPEEEETSTTNPATPAQPDTTDR
ncbi:serine/threonine-protein kinase [Actinoplanes sp. NPDC051861]|uniref:serine/threonine-protein kinase n=1 Tax=Actinoplanes sp. NPDC051861 TaxID=3155170 RepID=UPI00341A9B0E